MGLFVVAPSDIVVVAAWLSPGFMLACGGPIGADVDVV